MRRIWLPFTVPKAFPQLLPQEEHVVGSISRAYGPITVVRLNVLVESHIGDLQFKSYMKYQINVVKNNKSSLQITKVKAM